MPQWLQILLSILSILTTLIIVIVGLIVRFSKNKKIRENAQQVEKWLVYVDKYVKEVEKLTKDKIPGKEKKSQVMKLLKKVSDETNIPFDEEIVSNLIENVVDKMKGKDDVIK